MSHDGQSADLSDEAAVEAAKEYLGQGDTVEFFERVANALLREHPSDVPVFCLEYCKRVKDHQEPSQEGAFNPKREEDNKYMKMHNVSDFLDKWILQLMADKPGLKKPAPQGNEERLEFHIRYLEGLCAQKS